MILFLDFAKLRNSKLAFLRNEIVIGNVNIQQMCNKNKNLHVFKWEHFEVSK